MACESKFSVGSYSNALDIFIDSVTFLLKSSILCSYLKDGTESI